MQFFEIFFYGKMKHKKKKPQKSHNTCTVQSKMD